MSAPRKLHVKVTQEHIERGKPHIVGSCPIALATGGLVSYDHIHIAADMFKLPSVAKRFINRFDAGEPVSPIEFDAELFE